MNDLKEKIKKIQENEYLCESFTEILSREVLSDEEKPRKKGYQMLNAVMEGNVEDFILNACGWSLETLINSVLAKTEHKFYDYVSKYGEEDAVKKLECLYYMKKRIYELSWYHNRCDNISHPSIEALNIFSDVQINDDVNLNELIPTLFNQLNEKVLKEREKAKAEGYFSEGFNEEYLEWDNYGPHRKFPNEVDLPCIIERIMKYWFDDEVEEYEYYEFSAYDFCDFVIPFKTIAEAEIFLNNGYFDVGTLFKVSGHIRTEVYSF